MDLAYLIIYAFYAYLGFGLFIGIYLILFRLPAGNTKFQDSGWGFRLMILPGLVALWPFVLMRNKN